MMKSAEHPEFYPGDSRLPGEDFVYRTQESSRGKMVARIRPDIEQGEHTALWMPVDDAVEQAIDFNDLYKLLDGVGSIEGSKHEYSAGQLKELITQVRSGDQPIDAITRTAGLREKVSELLER